VLSVVNEDGITATGSLLNEIVREGARRMPAAVLEADVNQYVAELAAEADEQDIRLVVRNGRHREQTVTMAAGPVPVRAPAERQAHRYPDR
jgi:putative transposase